MCIRDRLRGTIVEITTFSIFLKNLQAILIMFFGGIIIIVPAIVLSFNGFFLGAFFGYVMHGSINTASGVFTTWHLIAFTMPHGIFELPALVIAGAAGFRISTLIIGLIKNIIIKKPVKEQYWKFKDSVVLLAIAIVPVSYTHLDVYKRQVVDCVACNFQAFAWY